MADFVTADWHFGHQRILDFERSRFATIEEHNDFIIERCNKRMKASDLCYVLGDVGFGDYEDLVPFVKRIKCRKILVMGNHDQLSVADYLRMGFLEVHRGPVYYDENGGIGAPAGRIILSHEPVREALDNPYVINVHGHLHNSQLSLPNFFNVNVARTDYSPVDLHTFSKKAVSLTKARHESIGKEWYWNFYVWDPGKGPNI